MIRTKYNSNRIVRLADSIIRPSCFTISKFKNAVTDEEIIYRYGTSRVIVQGKLYEQDRGTLICLLELAKKNDFKPFDITPVSIAKEKGIKNPYRETALQPIRESIDRLLEATIRIKPEKGHGLTAKFCFIEGWLDSDDTGNLSVSPYLAIVRDLTLGTTNISLNTYFSLKSQIARSLYNFLASQRDFYTGIGYSIRTASLVNYIAYDTNGQPFWKVVSNMKSAINELKEIEFISGFLYNTKKYKTEGGLFTFYPAEKKAVLPEAPEGSIIEQMISEYPEEAFKLRGSINKFQTAFDKINIFLQAFERKPENFIVAYLRWLKSEDNEGKVKYISPALFDTDNEFFKEFYNELNETGAIMTAKQYKKDQAEREEFDKIHKAERLERKQEQLKNHEAQKQRLKELKENMPVCPFNHKFGVDFEQKDECGKCPKWDDCYIVKKMGITSE